MTSDRFSSLRTSWSVGIAISVLAALAAVLLLELLAMGYYRLYIRELKKPAVYYFVRQAPEPLLYEHLPGVQVRDADWEVSINSLGLRGSEEGHTKASGTVRILGIGDSVTFGLGISSDATFLKVLERLLSQRRDRPYQVLNGGVMGYNTFQEFVFLRGKGIQLAPDVVIVGFALNDWRGRSNINAGGFFSKRLYSNTFNGVTGTAEHLLMLLERRSFLFSALLSRMEALKGYLWPHTTFSAETYSIRLGQNFRTNPAVAQGWNEARAALMEMASLTRPEGIRLVVVVLPGKWQVYGPASGAAAPQEDIRELGRTNGIQVVDPLPRFLANRHLDLFLGNSSLHLGAAGHRIIAEELFRMLGA